MNFQGWDRIIKAAGAFVIVFVAALTLWAILTGANSLLGLVPGKVMYLLLITAFIFAYIVYKES